MAMRSLKQRAANRGGVLHIGGASGFWGDSAVGAPQLLASGQCDVIVFDYLAELTLSIMAAQRAKNPALGYATDFISVTLKTIAPQAAQQGVRLISNAGGLNPQACADAARTLLAELGLDLKVAVVLGDDVLPLVAHADRRASLDAPGLHERLAAQPELAPRLTTANAYLGARPIAAALDAGADIVITGRCVDSAVTLGALMHAFDWAWDDFDRLAQASLAGHVIECGCQATGGLHTDWHLVPDWPHIGYPIVECAADGGFVVTKPAGTGGLVAPQVVAEQVLYEIGDPAAYLLPDVVCDFTGVTVQQLAEHRVAVQGARGRAPGPHYKVSATYLDGWRCNAQLTIVGLDAAAKARRTAEAVLQRTSEMFAALKLPPYSRTLIEILGSEEASFGPHAQASNSREVVLHLAVRHPVKAALEIFAREIAPAGTSWAPGTTGASGRPSPAPSIQQLSFLLHKRHVSARVGLERAEKELGSDPNFAPSQAAAKQLGSDPNFPVAMPQKDWPELRLIDVAWARSGDKGDVSNIGVIARQPHWLPWIRAQLTPQTVRQWLAHRVLGEVRVFEVPGIHALNFLCDQALGGGGMASLRNDPLGKGMAQVLLAMPIQAPPEVAAAVNSGV